MNHQRVPSEVGGTRIEVPHWNGSGLQGDLDVLERFDELGLLIALCRQQRVVRVDVPRVIYFLEGDGLELACWLEVDSSRITSTETCFRPRTT